MFWSTETFSCTSGTIITPIVYSVGRSNVLILSYTTTKMYCPSIWSYTSYTFEKPLRGFSKTMHLRIETTLFLGLCVGDGDGINSTALLTLVLLTFFVLKNPIKNSKKSMIAELKTPLFSIINTSYSQRTIYEAFF